MKYPIYSIETKNHHQKPPTDGIFGIYALQEGYGIRHGSRTWSEEAAQTCKLLLYGEVAKARSRVKLLKSVVGMPQLHDFVPELLMHRNNTTRTVETQRRLHELSISRINGILKGRKDDTRPEYAVNGELVEAAALALLTRYAHPWMLAVPALPHHESRGDKRKHFDIGVALYDGEGDAQQHYLQVKSKCTGYCGNESDGSQLAALYDTHIQMVSGCCNLGLPVILDNRLAPDQLPAMLVEEYDGTLTDEGVRKLDVITDRLLFDMTADILPRGSYTM